jgi:hypothetical protein
MLFPSSVRELTPFLSTHLLSLSVVVADYVPKMMQVPARIGVLGLSSGMFLGLLKLSLGGPGIGGKFFFDVNCS